MVESAKHEALRHWSFTVSLLPSWSSPHQPATNGLPAHPEFPAFQASPPLLENLLGHKPPTEKSSNKFFFKLQWDSRRLCRGFLNTRFRSLRPKRSCSKGGKFSCEHDPTKKGKGAGHRSRSPVLRDNFCRKATRQKDREKFIWKRRSSSVFQLHKR